MELEKYEAKELTKEDLGTLQQCGIIPANTPPAIAKMFGRVCGEKRLSPFAKQIYLVPRKDKSGNTTYSMQTGIDGYRALAQRSGEFMGCDDYLFDEGLTEYQMIEAKKTKPITATCIVKKLAPNGGVIETTATVRWEEYHPGDKLGFMWKKMPFLMLGKCAESLALRKAFPDALGGIYTKEETNKPELNKEDIQLMHDLTGKLEKELIEYEVKKALTKDVSYELRDKYKELGLPSNISEGMITKRIGELKNENS